MVLTDRCARRGGRVLDFGGATGHFLAAVRRRRPDLRVTLIDISESACRCARETYGLEAICGSLSALKRVAAPFDVVVMSDVIYYEPEAATLWKLLPSLMADGGALLIRGPNVWRLIRVCQSVLRAVGTRRAWAHRDRIAFFNPEHLFVFSRRFLTRDLFRGIGRRPCVGVIVRSPRNALRDWRLLYSAESCRDRKTRFPVPMVLLKASSFKA